MNDRRGLCWKSAGEREVGKGGEVELREAVRVSEVLLAL